MDGPSLRKHTLYNPQQSDQYVTAQNPLSVPQPSPRNWRLQYPKESCICTEDRKTKGVTCNTKTKHGRELNNALSGNTSILNSHNILSPFGMIVPNE